MTTATKPKTTASGELRRPGLKFCLDPAAGGEQLAQRLDRELRVPVMTHSQMTGPMSDASQKLAEAIAAQRIEHPADEQLTRHVLSAAAKFYGAQWKFVKPKKGLPIDGVIALAIGLRVLLAETRVAPSTGYIPPSSEAMFV